MSAVLAYRDICVIANVPQGTHGTACAKPLLITAISYPRVDIGPIEWVNPTTDIFWQGSLSLMAITPCLV